jgi:serine protease Do
MPEDVVIEFDGKKVLDNQDFRIAVADTLPGRKTTIKVVRQGVEKTLEIMVAERQIENREDGEYSFEETEKEPRTEIGLSFDDVPPQLAKLLDISGGAYVTSVTIGSLADDAGLRGPARGTGDVIIAANGTTIQDKEDLFDLVKGLKSGEPVVLKFIRSGRNQDEEFVTEACYTSIVKP